MGGLSLVSSDLFSLKHLCVERVYCFHVNVGSINSEWPLKLNLKSANTGCNCSPPHPSYSTNFLGKAAGYPTTNAPP